MVFEEPVLAVRSHTPESRLKIAEAKRLWWTTRDTTETRRKIGLSSKGRIKPREKHPAWRGGRYISKRDGYVTVVVPDGTTGAKRANGRPGTNTSDVMLEHRWVMQQHLGRPLTKDEDVHHINGKKDDNRLENLKLVSHWQHFHDVICPHCGGTVTVK